MASKRRIRPLLVVLAVAVGLAAATPLVQAPLKLWMLRHQAAALAQLSDAQQETAIGRISEFGTPAIDILAELVGSERAVTSQVARRTLIEQVRLWQKLAKDEEARNLKILAESLAERVEDYSPAARLVASDLALHILNRMPAGEAGSDWLTACERITRLTDAQRRQLDPDRPGAAGHRDGATDISPYWAPPIIEELVDLDQSSSMSGGGLPLPRIKVPPRPAQTQEDDQEQVAVDNEPRPLEESSAMQPLRASQGPDAPSDLGPVTARPVPRIVQPRQIRSLSGSSAEPESEVKLKVPKSSATAADEETAVLRWMHELHASDAEVVSKAAAALERRGFGTVQLELARQLTDDDPLVRARLAETLPGVAGIDARVWLVWLSRDEDPEVRLAAINVMATVNDPQLRRRLEKMAREDTDERIARQAERFATERVESSERRRVPKAR